MKTEQKQIEQFEQLKGSDLIFAFRNRSGFIHFRKNGWVSFSEIHRDFKSMEQTTFERALDRLLAVSNFGNECDPKYDFLTDWYEYSNDTFHIREILEKFYELVD